MKKVLTLLMSCALFATSVYAAEGEMGSFGGISSGIKLDPIAVLAQEKTKKTSKYSLPYKENIYLTGKPVTLEGTIEIKPGKEIDKEAGKGNYTETYKMTAQNKEGTMRLTRNLTLETNYVYEASLKQTTKVTTAKKWTEIVTVDGKTYQLDSDLSHFSKSILEDETPGVLYYKGNVSYDAVYKGVSEGDSNVTLSVHSDIYGYDQAYAKTETQKRDITISLGDNKGYAIQETPTFTVYRDIEYGANEPTAISMAGNYKEIIRSEGVLNYNILQGNASLDAEDHSGTLNIASSPTIEQLPVPTTLRLNGHPAEPQIKKMFSMKIFDENASQFSPNQIVTKKEYVTMLVKALRIELPEEKSNKKKKSKKTEEVSIFTDLSLNDPSYKYAVAAYNAGLIEGTTFGGDVYLTREMMYLLNVRAIGLLRLGIGTADAYTPFVDDNQISSWAKPAIYAASKIGLITPENGYIFPSKKVTKAECATFLNQLIDYLRYDLQKDYNEKLLI